MFARAAFFLFVVLLAGCSGGERLAPVSGKVTMNGQPLVLGSVVFHPDAEKGNTRTEEVRGQLGADGKYEMKVGTRSGAPAGWYKVTIHAFPAPGPEQKGPPEPLGDERYRDPAKSGLSVQVVDNPATGAYDFDIKPFASITMPAP